MTVYVDGARNEYRGMKMCHMLADDLLQLHEFASALGLKRRWFQPASFPHYDVSATKRTLAIALGARAVTRHELVAVMRRVREQEWYSTWCLGAAFRENEIAQSLEVNYAPRPVRSI